MSEIRDRVRQKAIEILVKPLKVPYQTDAAEMMVQGAINQAEEILSIKEIAIVDGDAELPENKMRCSMRVIGEPDISRQVQEDIKWEMSIYEMAQQDMLKEGWRKVIAK